MCHRIFDPNKLVCLKVLGKRLRDTVILKEQDTIYMDSYLIVMFHAGPGHVTIILPAIGHSNWMRRKIGETSIKVPCFVEEYDTRFKGVNTGVNLDSCIL